MLNEAIASSISLRKIRAPLVAAFLAGIALSACTGGGGGKVGLSERVVNYGEPVPKGGGSYKLGSAYQIDNQWFKPREDFSYDRVGIASWYGDLFHGRRTANGEVFDMDALTAAHPTLPMPVLAEVTNLDNGRQIVVRINDRGPYRHNRIIDLSRKSAMLLGFRGKGTAQVRVRYLRKAPMNGDDSFEQNFAANMMARQQATAAPRYAYEGEDRSRLRSIGRRIEPASEAATAQPSAPVQDATVDWRRKAFENREVLGVIR